MNLKKHFEANMLDGFTVETCGRNMMSVDSVWEYLQEMDRLARIDEWRAILGVDFDQFYPEDKFKDFIKVPSFWINQQISEINMDVKGVTKPSPTNQ
jgi:hypothetical protein